MSNLIYRRVVQILIIVLFFISNNYAIDILVGNLSFSKLLNTVPLSDPFLVLQILFSGSIVAFDVVLGALIVSLFYGVFFGRAFCSWVCPINMVTDFSSFLRKKLSIKTETLDRSIKYYTLGLSLVLSMIFAVSAFEMISPIAILHRSLSFGIGFGITFVVAIFLLDTFLFKDGWCSSICPLGAFYSLLGKKALFSVRYDFDKCSKCMKCKAICPQESVLKNIAKKSDFFDSDCTLCGRCIDVCSDDALNFDIRKNKG